MSLKARARYFSAEVGSDLERRRESLRRPQAAMVAAEASYGHGRGAEKSLSRQLLVVMNGSQDGSATHHHGTPDSGRRDKKTSDNFRQISVKS